MGDITHRRSDQPAEEVIAQTPLAQQRVARGESVALEVSGGPDYGILIDTTGRKTLFTTVKLVVPAGDSFQQVRISLRDELGTETIYQRIHEPGDEIALDFQVTPGVQVRVHLDDKLIFEKSL